MYRIYKTIWLIILVHILINQTILAQNKFSFYKVNKLYTSSIEGDISFLGSDIKIKNEKIINTSKYYTYSVMPSDVLIGMQLSEGMGFYSALQSIDNENQWIFIEIMKDKEYYNISFYNHETKEKKLIFSQEKSPDSKYKYIPFAWNNDILFLEAKVIGSSTENEGIWSYNIVTKEISKLSINPNYLSTPVISPDGKYFIYGGTQEITKGLDSPINIIYIYDISANVEVTVESDINSWYSILGWFEDSIETNDLINIYYEEESNQDGRRLKSANQVPFKLPWVSGISYCVSTGTYPSPPGPIGSTTICTNQNPHKYIAIDFDTPNDRDDPVLAVADGVIDFAGWQSTDHSVGFGLYVRIEHSDGTYTYYGHLKSISVNVGDIVQQGCRIGIEGTTGESSGDHIHFERRDANYAKYTNSWPVFGECGCTPHQNYLYTSNNEEVSCGVTPPDNDDCSGLDDKFELTSNGSCMPGTVEGATTSYGPNACEGCGGCDKSKDDNDVYYKFIAKATSHTVTVNTESNDFDAVIELRTDCGYYTSIGCWDPSNKPTTVSHTWDNLTIGKTYYIRVYEYNNSATPPSSPEFEICVTHSTTSVKPDLIVVSENVQPTTVAPGQPFTVSCKIKNLGTGNAVSSYTAIWLSKDEEFDGEPTDYNLNADMPVSALNIGASSNTLSEQVVLPGPMSPGPWYIMFGADALDDNNESDEYNNQVFFPITIGSTCTTPGTPATATGTVTGQTTADLSWSAGNPAGSSTVTYYWAVGTSSSVTYESGYVKRGSTTGLSASATGLTAGTKYYLRVYAETSCDGSESGYKTSSSFTTDVSCTTPGTPATATGTVTGQTTADLSWSAGSPVGSSTVTYYWVVGTSSTVTYGNGVAQNTTTGTTATVTGLSAGTTYYLRVYAKTSCDGTSSGYRTSSSFTTSTSCITPGTPASAAGSATGQTTADLSWSAGSPAGSSVVTYYWVVGTSSSVTYGNGVAQNTTTGTTATVTGLSAGTTYYLRVYAKTSCDGTSSGYRTSSSFTTSTSCITPGTPASAAGSATGQTTADLSWSAGSPAGSSTVTYYWVVGTSSSVTYGNGVAQNTTTGTTASVTGLSAGTTYYLRVYAKTSCDETSSGYRTSSSFTTSTTCISPTAPSSFTFSIGNPANGLEHHLDATVSEVSVAEGYSWEYSWDGIDWNINFQQSTGSYLDWNINDSPNQPIYWRIRAYSCIDKLYSTYTYATPLPIYTACDEPAIPTVNGATSNSLDITLNAETPVENPSYTNYSIYCATNGKYVQSDGTLGNTEVFKTKAEWGTKTVTGLSQNTQYCFYAKAKNGDGDIRFNASNSACGTTLQGTPLTTPLALAASGISQTGFSANWNASSNASGYRLDVALNNTFSNYLTGYQNKDVGNVITVPITGLSANTTYYYRVRAYNSSETSDVSNTVNVSTLTDINTTTLTIGSTSGSAGSTISIPVSAVKFVDVVGFQFTIVYDKTKLDYVNCSNWSGGTNVSDVLVTSLASDGKITFIYNNAAINITDGKFFDLNFTIKSNATGSAALSWSDNPTIREISNSQSQEIPCTYNNGTLSIVTGFNLTGKLIYENTAQTSLSNISISLLNSNSQSVGSAITDATGSFSYPGLSNGNYTLKPDVKISWGGASAMDITLYKKHIGNISQLAQVQVKSGDVNGSNSLSSMDLTIIKQRIGAQISSFTTGDWVYDPLTANINGTNLVQNIKALCYGDANGSYTSSSLKSVSNILLAGNEKISLLRNGEIKIPFMVDKTVKKLSSVTLSIIYPSELFDVNDVKMIANNEDLYYSVKDGKINVIYSTLNSISLKEGDILMTIKFSLKKDANQAFINENYLDFSGSGEFGDYDDKVLEDVKLIYSTFDVNTLINEFRKDEIKVYPNPASNLLTVTNVNDTRINILDMLGRSLISVNCQSNSIDLNIRSLIPGTYTLKVNKNNEIFYRKFTVVR